MPKLTHGQQQIVAQINAEARNVPKHLRHKFKLAAVETGLVESGLRNLHYGDADSQGWRQERTSIYGPSATNVSASVARFREEFLQHYQRGETAGQVAADVQRPAAQFRGRYQQAKPQARAILAQYGGGGGGVPSMPGYSTQTVPGVDNSATRQQLKLDYLANYHDPNALLQLAAGLRGAQDTSSRTVRVRSNASQPAPSAQGGFDPTSFKGTASFDGKKVAAWIAPILSYARQQGWKGSVNSGFRSDAEQKAIYDSGVRPAAVPKSEGGSGSNHEGRVYPLGAIDVSEAKQLARILKRSPYAKYLQYAGSRDPVHFSKQRNGTY